MFGKAKFGKTAFSQLGTWQGGATPPVLFPSRDPGLCMSWRSSDLIVEQSRERHQVRIFCIHVPPTDTFVCTCLLEFKTAATASWIFVLLCVNVVLHAHVCFSDCVPCNSCHQYKCICAVLCCAMLCCDLQFCAVLCCAIIAAFSLIHWISVTQAQDTLFCRACRDCCLYVICKLLEHHFDNLL